MQKEFLADTRDPKSMGALVRAERRRRGLNQIEFADLIGACQPRVSRWEAGKEEIPRQVRLRMIDLFFNTSNKFDSVLTHWIRTDPSVSIMSGDSRRILWESPLVLDAYKLERNDVDGSEHAQLFDARFKSAQNIEIDFLFVEYERDVESNCSTEIPIAWRNRMRMYPLNLTDFGMLILRQTVSLHGPMGDEGALADFKKYVKLADLDF